MNTLRAFITALLLTSSLGPSWAGAGTITTKDASGVTKTFDVTTDGSGNFNANSVICDQAAAATCASVGTAGSPSTNALTVQAVTLGHGTAANAMRVELPTDGTGVVGLAAGSAVIGHVIVDSGTVTTVSTVTNLAQMNGAALLMGNGVTGTGSQRVTIASDNTAFSVNLGTIGGAATAANQASQLTQETTTATGIGAPADATWTSGNGSVIALLKATATSAGAALPTGTNRVGYTSDDPCSQKIKTTAAFSTSSGGPVSIVALSGSTVVYVCSISAIADTAIKLSFIDGTGGSCAAATHAIWGSTTAANGMSLAANGGFTEGSGNGTVGQTTAASALCLLQSGTSLVAGNVSYVQQ